MRRSAALALFLTYLTLSACGGEKGKGHEHGDSGAHDGGRTGDGGSSGDGDTSGGDGDGDGTDGSVLLPGDGGTPFPINDAGQVLCGTAPCQCADGLDNDDDGVSDLSDPECVSSWDNDEGSFATGISGDNRDGACQDCFFDGNSGSGDDGCRIPTSCIETGEPTSGQGSCNKCEQTDQCVNFCRAFTPNGCDCFGCCAVTLGSNIVKNVLLGTGCSIDGDTLDGCTECVPNDSCINTCGTCELCPGKTADDLPAECYGTPGDGDGDTEPGYTCDDGETLCGDGVGTCSEGYFCQFGCCVASPVVF